MNNHNIRKIPNEARRIESRATYMIYENKTKLPYMDKKRSAYLFYKKAFAENFCKENKFAEFIETGEYFNVYDLFETLYRYGFKNLVIVDNKEIIIPVTSIFRKTADEVMPHIFYYNPSLSAIILFSLQHEKTKLLDKIKNNEMIIPCKISDDETVNYAGAKNKDQLMYPVFTDMKYFEEWNKWGWKPLIQHFYEIKKITKDKSIVINPATNFSITLKGGEDT